MDEMRFTRVDGGVTAAKGFFATGVSCGLKEGGYKDIGMIWSEKPCEVAASFTGNRVKAHPVLLDVERVNKGGKISAVVVNSGNANCLTGPQGDVNALAMAETTEKGLGIPAGSALVASTGVIGVPLKMSSVTYGIEKLCTKVKSETDYHNFAFSIMTTDNREKHVAVEFKLGGKTVRLGLTAKGAGMIKPKLDTLHATMLVFITTDAALDREVMQAALKNAVDFSFNRICVDNDTSTNDTVILLSNGAANNAKPELNGEDHQLFADALRYVCTEAAKLLARDGEGANKLIEIRVKNAVTANDAKKIAVAISESYLVKTAFYGGDPNWGRIVAAMGYADAKFDIARLKVSIDGIPIFENGTGIPANRGEVASEMAAVEQVIDLDLGIGGKDYTMWTCDLSYDYIKINAHYST